jgi:hypothetical protein
MLPLGKVMHEGKTLDPQDEKAEEFLRSQEAEAIRADKKLVDYFFSNTG